jgi:hypothetical protein
VNIAEQAVNEARRAFDPAILGAAWPPTDGNYRASPVTAEIIARTSSAGYPLWWAKVGSVGYRTRPVHLVGRSSYGTRLSVLARCKNRRGVVCPSCSDLLHQTRDASRCCPDGNNVQDLPYSCGWCARLRSWAR